MKFYNTLTRQTEEFVPLVQGKIKMYSCGPTVYRYIHVGNLRTFTMADWMRRLWLYQGYQVTHIKNITDVGHMRIENLDQGEDKLVSQARKEGKTSADIAKFYTQAFLEDEKALNILPATFFPRATQHIPEMIEIIEGLIKKGLAYEVGGNVYFNIKKFPEYGQLSGNQLDGMLEGVRDNTATDRVNPEDFPLWKVAEPGREMAWDSPWGRGFPGWHIECSAMSMKYLGEQFDVHTGGVDNIFPHHEDEIAQSEGFTGHRFVNFWVHSQHLLADGLKMAKSTGNAYTRADVEARGFEPLSLRYFYTTAHYRSRINFTFTALKAAQTSLFRLRAIAARLVGEVELGAVFSADNNKTSFWNEAFLSALENDLNLPQAMAVLWKMLKSPKDELSPSARLGLLVDWDRILGLGLEEYLRSEEAQLRNDPQLSLKHLPPELVLSIRQREELRRRGEFQKADVIRAGIFSAGYEVRDTRQGSLIFPKREIENFPAISSSQQGPDRLNSADLHEFSVLLLAQNSRSDLERCISSIRQWKKDRDLEIVIIDNGSTDDTLPFLQGLAKEGITSEQGDKIPLQILFADHNLGFAAGRNITFKASTGRILIMLDTSIELKGDIWTPISQCMEDRTVGLAGPYALATSNLRDFYETTGPEADAIEGYLLTFRRDLLKEIGFIDEKFRFYRLMDIYLSFLIKAAGYRAVALSEVASRIIKHPHLEWYSLTEEEQRSKSKKNFDLFRERWHHGESLLALNYNPENSWGHDGKGHLLGTHYHNPAELPESGLAHSHKHQHWADHDHVHIHYHTR